MNIVAVIPARYGSTRFQGKPLVKIAGVALIQRVYHRVEEADRFSRIIVATDDPRILDLVRNFGGEAVMTDTAHFSGTDRVWQAVKDSDFSGVVNIQGDEPLIDPSLIGDVSDALSGDQGTVVTAAFENKSHEDFLSPHVVKVVLDSSWKALYFSRAPIPSTSREQFCGFRHHIGIYGYSKENLGRFVRWGCSPLEKVERLEQLRFIEHGVTVRVLPAKRPAAAVDTPEDVPRVEALLGYDHEKD